MTTNDAFEILQLQPLPPEAQARLEADYRVHDGRAPDALAALLADGAPHIRAVVAGAFIGVDAPLLERLPACGLVSCFGVGYDRIDVAACRARGIAVTNTPDVLTDATAEMAVGLMHALARRLPQADRHVRDGRWIDGQFPLATELNRRTAGVVGLGRIGKEIARRLVACRMRVVYHGRRRQPDAEAPYPYYGDLSRMAAACDWLVVAAPGGSETRGLISANVLDALGPTGRLINIGRGEIVDEAALLERLRDGRLAGAALDVFETEPHDGRAFADLDNTVLAPHIGSATRETREAMGALTLDNIDVFRRGEALLTPV